MSRLSKIAVYGIIGAIAGVFIGSIIKQYFKKQDKIQEESMKKDVNKNHPQATQHEVNQSIKTFEEDIENYDTVQQNMSCPISGCIMRNPVIVKECGHTFEKKQIINWIRKQGTCPLCKLQVQEDNIQINYQLKQVIRLYERTKKSQQKQLLVISKN